MKRVYVRIPTPRIITASGAAGIAYCWTCEHKGLGLGCYGDTAQQAIDSFIEAVPFEQESGWIPRKYKGAEIVLTGKRRAA